MKKAILMLIVFGMILISINFVSAITWDNQAYYRLDGASGDVIDATGNGYDAINYGATRGVDGKINYSFNFDGDYVIDYSTLGVSGYPFTISAWFNTSGSGAIFNFANNTSEANYGVDVYNNKLRLVMRNYASGQTLYLSGTTVVNDLNWHHVVLVADPFYSFRVYLDGSLEISSTSTPVYFSANTFAIGRFNDPTPSQYFYGKIDEVGVWDRVLYSDEIAELYNGGSGITYGDGKVKVFLVAPKNDSKTSQDKLTFEYNISCVVNYSLDNSTLYIYYDNGTLFTSILNSSLSGNYTTIVNNVTLYDFGNYYWNVKAFASNTTGAVDNFTSENRTFSYAPFNVDSEQYSNTTTEGDTETFKINITILEGFQLQSGTLYYDGVGYSGTLQNLGSGKYQITRTITIPSVDATTNKTFYWTIVMEDGTQTNSTSHIQTVYNINIDDCSTYTYKIFNLSLVDEETQVAINETSEDPFINVNIDIYSIGSTTPIIEYSHSFTNSNSAQICIDNSLANSSYEMDAKFQYGGIDYRTEQYNIQKFNLNSSSIPQNITLYDILTSDSEGFTITVKDSNFQLLQGALLDISREYVGEGKFKSIEIPITDSNGRAIASLSPEDTTYTIYVIKDGEILASFQNIVATCQDELAGKCEINLNIFSSVTTPQDYTRIKDISFNIDYNQSSRTINVEFLTFSGAVASMELDVLEFDRYLNNTVCSDSLSSSSGTLSCTIPESYVNQTVVVQLTKDGDLIYNAYLSLKPNPKDFFGIDAIIFALLMVMTIPLMFITSTVGIVIGGMLSLIFASLLIFVSDSSAGIATGVMWILVAGMVLLWRMTKGGSTT